MKGRVRRKYDKEFKLMVVNLCLSGKDAKEVASDMDLEKSMFQRWVREYHVYSDNSFKGNGKNDVSFVDHLLYKQRFVIERINAWLDAFKSILVRFETKRSHWKALNIIAFFLIHNRYKMASLTISPDLY